MTANPFGAHHTGHILPASIPCFRERAEMQRFGALLASKELKRTTLGNRPRPGAHPHSVSL
jgi:hypothetical protein